MSLDEKVNKSFLSKVVRFPGRVWSKCKDVAYSALQVLPNHPGVFVVDHVDPWTDCHEDTWLRKVAITTGAVAAIAALTIGGWVYRREIHAELDPAYRVRFNQAMSDHSRTAHSNSESYNDLFWYLTDKTDFPAKKVNSMAVQLGFTNVDNPRRVLDCILSLDCSPDDAIMLSYRIMLFAPFNRNYILSSDDAVRIIEANGCSRADEIFGNMGFKARDKNVNRDELIREYLGEK